MKPDDIRIPDSFALAVEQGLAFTFDKTELKEAHPNTAILQLSTAGGRELEVPGFLPRRRPHHGQQARRHQRKLQRRLPRP